MFNISDTKIGFTAAMKVAYLDCDTTAYDRAEEYPLLCHVATDEAVEWLKNGGSDTGLCVIEDNKTLIVVTLEQAKQHELNEVTIQLVGNQWVKPETYSIRDYIDIFHGGSQASLARAMGVKAQQITQWIKKGFFISGKTLCSIRREL